MGLKLFRVGAAIVLGMLALQVCSGSTSSQPSAHVSSDTSNIVTGSVGSGSSTILQDGGGEVASYALQVRRAANSKQLIRFAGRCDSACTLYLQLPRSQTCILPGASFGFHLPSGGHERSNRRAARFLLNSYPGWVRSWIAGQGGLKSQLVRMDYGYARQYVRACRSASVFPA